MWAGRRRGRAVRRCRGSSGRPGVGFIDQILGHQGVHDALAAGDDHIAGLVLDGVDQVAVDELRVKTSFFGISRTARDVIG